MPTTRYILDPAEVGGRLTVILDTIRAFIERRKSAWGRFYCLLYGSYAYRVVHQASDIDLVIVADCLDRDDKIELMALVERLHRHLGADLDHEIPYEKKISITITDMERAVTGTSLRSSTGRPFPKIEKSPEVLSSPSLLDRFFCGMLLHPHIFVAGQHDLYMRHRSKATRSVLAVAQETIGPDRASVDELIGALCEYEGNTGDTHLGFEKCEPFISHLKETLPLMLNHGGEGDPAAAEGDAGHAPASTLQPVFVMGCPRSGTTMLGHLLGTCDGMLNAQELSALYFTHCMTDQEYRNVPSPYKAQYIASVRQHAAQFYGEIISEKPFRYVVETTPWNLRIAQNLETQFPKALFILCYRNPEDVVESLRKSYELGYSWAGPSDTVRCVLWRSLYQEHCA